VVIASNIDVVQIWDKDTYEKLIQESTENNPDLAEEVMGEIDFDDD